MMELENLRRLQSLCLNAGVNLVTKIIEKDDFAPMNSTLRESGDAIDT